MAKPIDYENKIKANEQDRFHFLMDLWVNGRQFQQLTFVIRDADTQVKEPEYTKKAIMNSFEVLLDKVLPLLDQETKGEPEKKEE